ncbi:MAG: YceI family protein [Candidatus Eremiobacteraeota bacterium]|nr:YceI family protein [Candidatus Eremiobacteraeota bacterium]
MNRAYALTIVLAAVAGATAFAAAGSTWSADPVHSSATFTATHLGISHVTGTIPLKSAEIVVPDGSNIPSSVRAALDPSGIDTHNGMRDGDLRSPHFFETSTYAEMTFASTKITPADPTHFTIAGNLTMHGQTHPMTLDAQYLGRGPGMGKNEMRIAYSAKGTIDRSQWGMTYGNPVVSNTVDIEIDVEAVKL